MRRFFGAVCLASSLFLPEAARAAGSAEVVATAGGTTITKTELDEAIGAKLFELESEAYSRKVQTLNELINKRLEAQEAARRGISMEELLKAEVEDKVDPVKDSEVNATYQGIKARFRDKTEEDLKKLITEDIKRQHVQARRKEFVRELRESVGIQILLEPPRLAVGEGGDPTKGPKDAPVTLLEFSDFQCPYCGRVEPIVKRLEETYGDKIRLVFRNFPLPTHPQAPKAAEAAACAGDQGKFWDMHDRLFAHQDKLQIADLKASAAELGLDPETFSKCLDSGKYEANWKTDQKEGDAYGVQATPWFFINGRLLSGAQPYENFAQIIDDELSRKGARAAKAP